ncbi:MAG: glycosyl transferase, partial [Flavobacterium piscis]|nr:glycosyl transferase [Flavobacterium piscis]
MKLLQINSTVNSGSTGRIAEDIGKVLIANGHESYIAFGRGHRPSQSKLIRIGNAFDVYWHGLQTLLFDRH